MKVAIVYTGITDGFVEDTSNHPMPRVFDDYIQNNLTHFVNPFKEKYNADLYLTTYENKINESVVEENLCIIALVGENMKNHQGLSGKMFSTLGKNNVNIRAIAQGASERNISAVINKRDIKKALNTLHECFFEDNAKQLNLFVMGVGNVGEKFIEQIHQQKTII